jgi:hypothetical protein
MKLIWREATVPKVSVDQIISPQEVIHPCLDWVKEQLIVGVNLKGGQTAVLSSTQGLVKTDGLGMVCEQGKKFCGAVSERVATEFEKHITATADQRKPEDGKKLLEDIATYLKRFVVFPQSWFPDVLATWILGSYLFPVFQTYPYLWITSATPGCGKTALGGLIAQLSFNGDLMVAPTEAQLFHLPETSRGVQVWDEVETSEEADKKRFNMIRPVLLNGYRNGGVVPRQTGKQFDISSKFHVFCPRVLIGLTKLPEAALQRTIQVHLVKRTQTQGTELYIRAKCREQEAALRERCLLWVLETVDQVDDSYQDDNLRKELETLLGPGRASDDIWLPVFAVARAAKGDKPTSLDNLQKAAKELATAASSAASNPHPPVHREATPSQAGNDRLVLEAALNVMVMEHSQLTPEELAKRVANVTGAKVTSQSLSKGLARIGIRAKRQKGCRVFAPTPTEQASARRRLQGDSGQQDGRTAGQERIEARPQV